jgi:hypothetical protein
MIKQLLVPVNVFRSGVAKTITKPKHPLNPETLVMRPVFSPALHRVLEGWGSNPTFLWRKGKA